jgi:hypothetical protein
MGYPLGGSRLAGLAAGARGVRVRKLIGAVSACIVFGSLAMFPAGSASAGTGCVTRAEYNQVQNGMGKQVVHRIFDTAGQMLDRQTT